MTQQEAVEKGYTHFIEVWRSIINIKGQNCGEDVVSKIRFLDNNTKMTKTTPNIYTVCVWLIKPKNLN